MCEHPDPPSFNDDFPPAGLSLDDAPADFHAGAPATADDDWRVLLQTNYWVGADGRIVRLVDLSAADLAHLRGHLHAHASVLHAAAAAAERAATSSGVAWMFRNLNIGLISDLTPAEWLATTPLMRWLNQQAPPESTGWDTHDLGPRCTDGDCEEPR